MFERIERAFTNWEPASRRRFAVHLLVWSVTFAVINVALYAFKIVDESMLILITLILSWLAITFTAADLIATTDVREED